MKYFIIIDNSQHGPYTMEEMRGMYLTRSTPVWHEGLVDWTTIERIPALCRYLFGSPTLPAQPAAPAQRPVPPAQGAPYGQQFRSPQQPPEHSSAHLNPKTWMVNAIVVTVLGVHTSIIGMIFGILAIFRVNKSQNMASYDFDGSQSALRRARTFCILGYVFAAIGFVGSMLILRNVGNVLSLQDLF